MKKILIILYAIGMALMALSFIGCNDDNDETLNNDPLLPRVIKTQQSYDADPQYEYTLFKTFSYDDLNRPTRIVTENYRRLNNGTDNTLVYSITTDLSYNMTDNTISRSDVIKRLTTDDAYSTMVQTYEYKVSPENSSIINVLVKEEYEETIELTNGLVSKHTGIAFTVIPEKPIMNYTHEYQYNDKGDISQDKYTISSDKHVSVKKYEYDNFNGVYKSMNIPQWLFTVLFEEQGRINNIKKMYLLHDNEVVEYGTNKNTYNRSGYPAEILFYPDESWYGIWGSRTTLEYIDARPQAD